MADNNPEGLYTTEGAITVKNLIPYILAAGTFGVAIWSISSQINILKSTEEFQATEIAQLEQSQNAAQSLSYTISNELASLQQSVADIKASVDTK